LNLETVQVEKENGMRPKRTLIEVPRADMFYRDTHLGNSGIGTNAVKEGMTLKELLANPSVSQWLKDALMTAYDRDPVDAIRDAQSLLKLLGERYTQIVTRSPGTFGQ
jgi:hypothetical protein